MNIEGIILTVLGLILLLYGAYGAYRIIEKKEKLDPVIVVFPAIIGMMIFAVGRMMISSS
jgi:hypothetical protein